MKEKLRLRISRLRLRGIISSVRAAVPRLSTSTRRCAGMAAFFRGAALHLRVMPLDLPSTVDLAGREGLPPTVRFSIDPPPPCEPWRVCIQLALCRVKPLSHDAGHVFAFCRFTVDPKFAALAYLDERVLWLRNRLDHPMPLTECLSPAGYTADLQDRVRAC